MVEKVWFLVPSVTHTFSFGIQVEAMSVYPKVGSPFLNYCWFPSRPFAYCLKFQSLLHITFFFFLFFLSALVHLEAKISFRRPKILEPIFRKYLLWVG